MPDKHDQKKRNPWLTFIKQKSQDLSAQTSNHSVSISLCPNHSCSSKKGFVYMTNNELSYLIDLGKRLIVHVLWIGAELIDIYNEISFIVYLWSNFLVLKRV